MYGIETDETMLDDRLATRFDYDGIWGTVLNRFCIEAAIGHPLTVHGKGGQTRGYLNIRDTMRCIELAMTNPASPASIACSISSPSSSRCWNWPIWSRQRPRTKDARSKFAYLPDPRVEAEKHYYNAKHTKLIDLGLQAAPSVGDR